MEAINAQHNTRLPGAFAFYFYKFFYSGPPSGPLVGRHSVTPFFHIQFHANGTPFLID
jgi:hypothetical protein